MNATALALNADDNFDPTDKQKHRWERAIANAEPRFLELAGGLDYNAERVFAYQLLSKTDFAMSIAERNPRSVLLAMVNLAATGLTLNPAHAYAYLVPRDGAIVLDISYRGFIKIATDSGAILWARAALVYEGDNFTYRGPAEAPDIETDPFRKDRTVIRGVYCIAKTADGATLCDTMSLADLERVRATSEAFKKGKGPWLVHPDEMMKKTILKRARKTWPQSVAMARLDRAIEIANESEGGYDLTSAPLRIAGSPNDGVWEAVDQATQIELERIAMSVRDFHEAGDIAGAFDFIESQRLDTDETAALHTRFDSKIRSALKRERASRRPA